MDQPNQGVATAPPPPSEVKVRTMKSDIAMMAASGGGMPRFENVKVAGLAAVAEQQAAEAKADAPASAARAESKSNLALIVVLVVLFVALAVVGWFVYLKLKG